MKKPFTVNEQIKLIHDFLAVRFFFFFFQIDELQGVGGVGLLNKADVKTVHLGEDAAG